MQLLKQSGVVLHHIASWAEIADILACREPDSAEVLYLDVSSLGAMSQPAFADLIRLWRKSKRNLRLIAPSERVISILHFTGFANSESGQHGRIMVFRDQKEAIGPLKH